jgi:hypothetical protein
MASVESICRENRTFLCADNGSGSLLLHHRDHFSRCHELRIRKSFSNCVYAEEMISVAMGRVNRCQILPAGRDPLRKLLVRSSYYTDAQFWL